MMMIAPAQQPALHRVVHATDETRVVEAPAIVVTTTTSTTPSTSTTSRRDTGQSNECGEQRRCRAQHHKLMLGWHVRKHVSQTPPQHQLSRQFQQQRVNLNGGVKNDTVFRFFSHARRDAAGGGQPKEV